MLCCQIGYVKLRPGPEKTCNRLIFRYDSKKLKVPLPDRPNGASLSGSKQERCGTLAPAALRVLCTMVTGALHNGNGPLFLTPALFSIGCSPPSIELPKSETNPNGE